MWRLIQKASSRYRQMPGYLTDFNWRNYKYYLPVIAVIIVMLYVLLCMLEPDISGFWQAPATFCDEAGLTTCSMAIGSSSLFGSLPNMYLLMANNSGIIVNQPIDMAIWWSFGFGRHRKGVVEINGVNGVMPNKLDIVFDSRGKIVLSSGDTVYAVLHRNPDYNV